MIGGLRACGCLTSTGERAGTEVIGPVEHLALPAAQPQRSVERIRE